MRRSTRAAARVTQVKSDAAKRRHSQPTVVEKTISKRSKSQPPSQVTKKNVVKHPENEDSSSNKVKVEKNPTSNDAIAYKKWKSWSANATSTPYPDFGHPTPRECQIAHDILYELHNSAVEAEFDDENTPKTIPFVLDAMLVAVLSQATSWSNAKRAMNSMKAAYGSVFAYDAIFSGGLEKLQDAIRCGGLHIRKTKIIFSILEDVKARYGRWNLDHLLEESDEDAMKELMSYKYIGPKSAFVVMGWCLKRNRFTVDTHVYRIAGLWGWRPQEATREKAQLHLDAVIPVELKFKLHFFLIQHGRTCPACRGGAKGGQKCEVLEEARKQLEVLAEAKEQ